jgi:hypothetical protein
MVLSFFRRAAPILTRAVAPSTLSLDEERKPRQKVCPGWHIMKRDFEAFPILDPRLGDARI